MRVILRSAVKFSTMTLLLLIVAPTGYPLPVAASSPIAIYSHNVLEVPVEFEGLTFEGFLKLSNGVLQAYVGGSLSRNHTLEGSVDLKFRKTVENNTFKASLHLDTVMANVTGGNLNFTLNATVYCEGLRAEGELLSTCAIEARYTDRGALAKTLGLKSVRVDASSTIVSIISKNHTRLTVESLIEPRTGVPMTDKILTAVIATVLNETLKEINADLERIPGVTFDYEVNVDMDKAQVRVRIVSLITREVWSGVFDVKLEDLEKEGVVKLEFKPGIVEFKANTTIKTMKHSKKYFEASLKIGESKLKVSLTISKTLGEDHSLEAAEILEAIMQVLQSALALQGQLTLIAAARQGVLEGMERALVSLEKGLPTQYQIPTYTITPNQTMKTSTVKTEAIETPKIKEEGKVNIPLIMTLLSAFTLALIAIAYRLLSRKTLTTR